MPYDSGQPSELLRRCARLRRFDRALLAALSAGEPHAIDELLAGDAVVRPAEMPAALALRDDLQAAAERAVTSDELADELGQRTRAFEALLGRLTAGERAGEREADERLCFFHLEQLFTFLYLRLEWQAIADHTAAARAADPRLERHQQRLAIYDAFVAIRTGEYDRGAALLDALDAQGELEDAVRLDQLLARGQMQRNLTHYDRALSVYERLGALALELGSPVYHGVALFNQGSVYTELDRYDLALERVRASLAIFSEHGDLERQAYAHYSVGLNAMYLGRWRLAQEHYTAAIGLFERLHMGATLATSYWSSGYLHLLLGDAAASEAAYQRAIALTQSSRRGEPIVAMDARWQLGFLYHTLGRHAEALESCDRALDHAVALRHDHRAAQIRFLQGRALEALGRHEDAYERYRRSIGTIESLKSEHTREDIKISLLGTTQQIFEAMVLLCLRLGRDAEAFEYVERARARAFLDLLSERVPELQTQLERPVATLAEVQQRLPAGAVLVEYFTTGVVPRGEHLISRLPPENVRLRDHLLLPAQVVIFAITRGRLEVRRPALDPNPLQPQAADLAPSMRLLNRRLLTELYEHLIRPVEPQIAGHEVLYLAPHGPLHYVPFAALGPAEGAYLLSDSGPALALAPSATVLVRNCLARAPAAGGALAIGYNDADAAGLEYAEYEAQSVARLCGGEAWVGPQAKAGRLLDLRREVGRLHLAGHAIYDPLDPLESYIQLGSFDRLSARAIMHGLDMRADLVVMNACTSGLSAVVGGDELLGLPRAFLYAGAATVVCTLWEAYDLVALLLMEQFYLRLGAGESPARALRDAQLMVRTMTGRDLAAAFERWRAAEIELPARPLPDIPPELDDTAIYADPELWAPFIVIGRA